MTSIVSGYAICNNCKAMTPIYMIESFNIGGPMHTDFYQENLGAQVVSFALSICNKCFFVGTGEEFKDIGNADQELEELGKKYPASKRYTMLADRLEKKGISKEELGNWYLQAAWAERMSKEGERSSDSITLEKEYLCLALKYFEEALEAGGMDVTPKNLYLIGELFRRIDNFPQAAQFFEKAKAKLSEEKYFCIFLNDPGADKKAISKKIREMISINRKQSFFLIDNVPSKILGSLTLEDAEKKVNEFSSLGAQASIKEDDELPPDQKNLFNLINTMERFAEQKDSSHQIIEAEYLK